jgi:hypothetical protein
VRLQSKKVFDKRGWANAPTVPYRTEAELLSGFSSPKTSAAQETRQIGVSCEKPDTIHDARREVQEAPLISIPMPKQDFHNLLIILKNL